MLKDILPFNYIIELILIMIKCKNKHERILEYQVNTLEISASY
jgi:hypothetical protein